MALIDKASLLMVPSVYEDGTLYNVLPSGNKAPDETGNHNGYDQTRADFTFSRGSNLAATRVNADGLIEKGRENLLLQSNQFDTTWLNSNSNETSGYSGYDGSNDAWLLTKSAANGMIYQSITSSGVQTLSVYAKEGTNSWMQIYAVGSTNVRAYYNLSNGTLGAYALNVIDRNIEDIGSGWYRCSVTFNSSLTSIRFFVSDGNNNDGGTSGSIYIQNAQLEYGLAASSYLDSGATTATAGVLENTPRIDYSSGAGALLLEPQRTNVLPHSEYFGLFNTLNGASITSNYSVSPEGVTNATRVLLDAQSQSRIETPINTGTTIANNNQTISCWVKSNGADTEFRLKCTHSSVLDYYSPNLTATSEWQRFTFTQLFGAGSSTTITAGILNSTANNAADLSIYGMQLEVNLSYPSSYVPTYGSAATRSFDNATTTSEEDVLTSGEGVVFMEFEIDDTTITGYPEVIRIENPSDTTDKFWFYIFDDSDAGEIRFGYRLDDTAVKKVEGSVTLDTTTTAKVAMRLENNNYALYYNGTKQTPTQYAGVVSNLRKITTRGREHFNGLGVKQFAIFNEALSDSELATLTTL